MTRLYNLHTKFSPTDQGDYRYDHQDGYLDGGGRHDTACGHGHGLWELRDSTALPAEALLAAISGPSPLVSAK